MPKLFIISIFLLSIFSATNAADIQTLRGQRYCEILLGNHLSKIKVYNTIGLNDCPERLWHQVDAAQIKHQTKAQFVHLNGPRYWMIDSMQNSNFVNPTIQVFGNLRMREAGVLKLNFKDVMNADKPYRKHVVNRETTWIYESGKPIYMIENTQGEIFIMQSFSIQQTNQTIASLATLKNKLHLPAGWKFSTKMLDKKIYVIAKNRMAVVIQDEFLNTYQQLQ